MGPQGQPVGSIATVPSEVDYIARLLWGKIYAGLISCPYSHAYRFMNKYREWIPKHPEFIIDPLTGADLHHTCTHGPKTAWGMDGWAPATGPSYLSLCLTTLRCS